MGGLRPGSDLDVFVVSGRRMPREAKEALIEGLVPLSRRGDRPAAWRPVELTVVAQSDVRPWRYPSRMDFQYGEWLHESFESGDVDPAPRSHADLGILITMVLLAGTPVVGPRAAEVLDPVPHDDLVRAMLDGVEPLLADLESDTANVVLTLARIWITLATGNVTSKDAAADWALPLVPEAHRPVLARARAVYLGAAEDRWDDLVSQVRPHAEHVVGRIDAVARGESP
jgi:streptomycin 3"-adenylyltransferase